MSVHRGRSNPRYPLGDNVKRLYKISVPGGSRETDNLISHLGSYTLAGSGFLLDPSGRAGGSVAFIQLYLEGDEQALEAAQKIVGPTGWNVSTGYGIHHREVSRGLRAIPCEGA